MRPPSLAASSCYLPLAWAVVLSSCAGTTTQQAPLPPGAVEAEQEKQQELVILENVRQQSRLDEATYPILTTGTSLCQDDRGRQLGVRFATVHDFPDKMQTAAARALRLGDSLSILSAVSSGAAARAGLRPGDRIIAVETKVIKPGREAAKQFTELFSAHAAKTSSDLSVLVQRGTQLRRVAIRPDEVCDYGRIVLDDTELNAFADGNVIYVTSAMMRFVDDDELRVVVSHEFAHNAMGHIKAKKKNSLFGAIVGALGDLAMASQGVNTGGYYTSQGAKLGAMTFSQDFEREADYVGIYALALADLPLNSAPAFWRRMAVANPKAIGFAQSHPTAAERFVRLEQGIFEVNRKIALKHPIHPDPAGIAKPGQQPEQTLARWDDLTEMGSSPPRAQASVAPPEVVFTRDGFGASRGYKEYRLPPEETQWAETDWSLLPSQPTVGPEAMAPSDKDWADPAMGPLRQSGDWVGQPHGRVYYRASCQAAHELPEPIYFETEEEAQLTGYQRSLVPGC